MPVCLVAEKAGVAVDDTSVDRTALCDIEVQDGTIAAITSAGLAKARGSAVDCEGRMVWPTMVDLHTHIGTHCLSATLGKVCSWHKGVGFYVVLQLARGLYSNAPNTAGCCCFFPNATMTIWCSCIPCKLLSLCTHLSDGHRPRHGFVPICVYLLLHIDCSLEQGLPGQHICLIVSVNQHS